MSNKATSQLSSFSIRFKPSSLCDDDDDDVDDDDDDVSDASELVVDPLSVRIKKKTVLFERQTPPPPPLPSDNLPPPPPPSAPSAAAAADVVKPIDSNGSPEAAHLPVSHSAPTSELTSPVSVVTSPTVCDKSFATTKHQSTFQQHSQHMQPTAEKLSLFSGLREKLDRLSAESKEIFDRKMRRSGSADAAKITALLNGTDVTADVSSKTVEMTDFLDKSSEDIVTTTVENTVNSLVHKSASTAQMSLSRRDDSLYSLDSATKKPKRASISTECGLSDCVAMSELLSSCSDTNNTNSLAISTELAELPAAAVDECIVNEPSAPKPKTNKLLHLIAVMRRRNVISILVAITAYLVIPLPPYISGLVTGVALTVIAFLLCQHLTGSKLKEFVLCHNIQSLPSVHAHVKQSKNIDGVFKGWMNELNRYDVTDYHINQTYSVFVTLEGSTMRLQTPKHGIPKRAICDEVLPSVTFVRQRHYNLDTARIILLPPDLVSKRLWSKKYPICIEVEEKGRLDKICGLSAEKNSIKWQSTEAGVDGQVTKCQRRATTAVLYLFGRTSRQKEEWYRRFVSASRGTPWPTRLSDLTEQQTAALTWQKTHRRAASTDSSTGSTDDQPSSTVDYSQLAPCHNLAEYLKYMASVLPQQPVTTDDVSQLPSLAWLNALTARCFLDFLREKYWAEKMREKIQKKLCKMHVPHFINKLSVTGIELGSSVPSVCRASAPYLDDRGLWVDLDISYTGGFCISMETKCNLMKLKHSSSSSAPTLADTATKDKRSAVTHSDEEDSAESTTDEENVEDNSNIDPTDDRRSEPMGKKLLRFVDKISQSRYFQQATEYKYIKKAMEEVSNTRLVLNVEMRSVTGVLAVNIPPPPTDRIWYGFRSNPNLVLSAKPRVGDREVSLTPVTDWIEKKLAIEFQRVFVMPNMDDIPISLMCAHVQQPDTPVQHSASTN